VRILSLGAGGFIGSHLTERLLADGHDVCGVDLHDDKLAACAGHRRFRFVRADIRARAFDLDAAVRGADLVIDLVAYANPGLYVRMPLEVFRLNFTENLRIAEACVRLSRRLLQFSSCEVYGKTVAAVAGSGLTDPEDPRHATFSEDTTDFILGPVSKHRWIYACAKQLLERVLHAYGLEDRLHYTIVRPFNFIGPRIDFLPSEAEGVPRVFSFFLDALLSGRPMQLVNGGSQRRCYTHIDDAVECIARMIERPDACDREIFNVGSPANEVSIRGLAERMRAVYEAHYRRRGEALSDMVEVRGEAFYGPGYDDSDRRIPDISKARRLLGWEPRRGLQETIEATMADHLRSVRGTCGAPRRAGGAGASCCGGQ
jgi:nucleoside-diphosphate-sugar epimerase